MSELKTAQTDMAAMIRRFATANSTGAITTGAALSGRRECRRFMSSGLCYFFGTMKLIPSFGPLPTWKLIEPSAFC